jgi:hypothetical protein
MYSLIKKLSLRSHICNIILDLWLWCWENCFVVKINFSYHMKEEQTSREYVEERLICFSMWANFCLLYEMVNARVQVVKILIIPQQNRFNACTPNNNNTTKIGIIYTMNKWKEASAKKWNILPVNSSSIHLCLL